MKDIEPSSSYRFTTADLKDFPDDGKRYEIIDGELFVSKQPHFNHQLVCTLILSRLHHWCEQVGSGRAVLAPGLIFAEDDDVAPDIVWVSSARLGQILGSDGKLHAAPELIVEVLSQGRFNERRDREAKLNLYSRRGVSEYWIVDWRHKNLQAFPQHEGRLVLSGTLEGSETLTTPLLPGFTCHVDEFFGGVVSEY
jgi:Uma2 family endonuclease